MGVEDVSMLDIVRVQSGKNINVVLFTCSLLIISISSCSSRKDATQGGLNMPVVVGETAQPKAAIYVDNLLSWSPAEPEIMVVIAVWEDGRVVWSKDTIEGGPPYWVGKIEPSKLDSFFDKLEQRELYKNPTPKELHYGPDSSFTVIAITDGPRQIRMESWHELFEASSKDLVGTAHGILAIEDSRSREEILAEQPETYKRFRSTWSGIRVLLEELIPDKGQITKDLDFGFTDL